MGVALAMAAPATKALPTLVRDGSRFYTEGHSQLEFMYTKACQSQIHSQTPNLCVPRTACQEQSFLAFPHAELYRHMKVGFRV